MKSIKRKILNEGKTKTQSFNIDDAPLRPNDPQHPLPRLSQLIQTYDDYIKLLGDEIHDLVGLWISHGGYNSPRIVEGKQFREKIEELKNELKKG